MVTVSPLLSGSNAVIALKEVFKGDFEPVGCTGSEITPSYRQTLAAMESFYVLMAHAVEIPGIVWTDARLVYDVPLSMPGKSPLTATLSKKLGEFRFDTLAITDITDRDTIVSTYPEYAELVAEESPYLVFRDVPVDPLIPVEVVMKKWVSILSNNLFCHELDVVTDALVAGHANGIPAAPCPTVIYVNGTLYRPLAIDEQPVCRDIPLCPDYLGILAVQFLAMEGGEAYRSVNISYDVTDPVSVVSVDLVSSPL